MSEHDIQLVTSQAGSVVAENQHVTLGTASSAITPATATAMIGINQGVALNLEDTVKAAMTKLDTARFQDTDPGLAANANIAYNAMTSLQSSLGFGGTPNHAAFGSFLNQAQGHIKDSISVRRSTDFMSNLNYSDFGSGITSMSSMVDRGIPSQFGSLSGAGAAIASTGSMFNGIDIKNFGSPTGLVQSLQNNKLANATGVNQKLTEAGVDLNDLDNPVYKDQISQVMGSIKDPRAINISADQFNITDPFGGLPSYTGNDSSLYNTPTFLGGTSTATPSTGATTMGSSTKATGIGADIAPDVGNAGGIQSLKDLSDYTKLANPGDTTGFTGGAEGIASKFKDMGAGSLVDASQAPSFFSSIQTASTPLTDAAHPTLGSLMSSLKPNIDSLTGSGNGPLGLPNIRDFAQHVGGGPDINIFNGNTISNSSCLALQGSVSNATNLWTNIAGVDLTSPPPNGLGSSMTFATNLHKFGADTSGSGIADVLHGMANTSTKYGESIRASLAEGKNNNLLSANGMGPVKTNPFEGVPSYTGSDSSLETGAAAKMLGG